MKADSPFAHVLHAERIAALARGRSYAEEGRVKKLTRRGARLTARVRGTEEYAIAIWVKGRALGYACTCPAGTDGAFCKHCVAVAITWVARQG